MTPLLDVRNLCKFCGAHTGCAGFSFTLWPGDVLGIVGARHYGQIRGAATDWLTWVIDTGRMDGRPSQFSGGMLQRLVGSVLQV